MNPGKLLDFHKIKIIYILKYLKINSIALEYILWDKIKLINDYTFDDPISYWTKNGKMHGEYSSWYQYDDYLVKRIEYITKCSYYNDNIHGKHFFRDYRYDNKITYSNYIHGRIINKKEWNNDKLYKEVIYDMEIPLSVIEYYESGKIKSEYKYYKDE